MIHYGGGAWGGAWGGAMYVMIYVNLNFHVKIGIVTWRYIINMAPPHAPPPIMYHEFFIYLMWYLFGIKKIAFVSHVWTSNGRIKRNTKKNHRFLVSRSDFSCAPWDLRFSKQLKIG